MDRRARARIRSPAQLRLQTIRRQAEAGEQIFADARITADRNHQVGQINQARAPKPPHTIRRLQQAFEIFANEEILAPDGGLLNKKRFELIKETVAGEREHSHLRLITRIGEQHLEQMLHIEISMAPTPRHILGTEQQIPGLIAETLRFGSEAGWRLGTPFVYRRHQGLAQADGERDASSISSILYPSGSSTKAITVLPCFIGPGSRTTRPPWPAIPAQVAWMSSTPRAMCP